MFYEYLFKTYFTLLRGLGDRDHVKTVEENLSIQKLNFM